MAKHGKQIVAEAMNEPVMCGGFIWSYGFLSIRLQKSGISDIYLAAATNRPLPVNAPDTRKLAWDRAVELWDALQDANLPVINSCMNEMGAL